MRRQMLPQVRNVEMNNMKKTVITTQYRGAVTDFLERCNKASGSINPLNPELNPIYYLLALLAHHFLHVSRIRVKSLTLRLLMSYIYIWSAYS